jgi:hypothetical protein
MARAMPPDQHPGGLSERDYQVHRETGVKRRAPRENDPVCMFIHSFPATTTHGFAAAGSATASQAPPL